MTLESTSGPAAYISLPVPRQAIRGTMLFGASNVHSGVSHDALPAVQGLYGVQESANSLVWAFFGQLWVSLPRWLARSVLYLFS